MRDYAGNTTGKPCATNHGMRRRRKRWLVASIAIVIACAVILLFSGDILQHSPVVPVWITVNADATGARVLIDGRFVGKCSPSGEESLTVWMRRDRPHDLRIVKPGYAEIRRKIRPDDIYQVEEGGPPWEVLIPESLRKAN